MHVITCVFYYLLIAHLFAGTGTAQTPYTLFIRNNLDKVYPTTRPDATELAVPLELNSFAAQGEYESVSFAALSTATMTGVTVSVTDLTSTSAVIPTDSMECRYVFNQRLYRTLGENQPYNLVPRVLYTMNDFDAQLQGTIPADSCTWFWVTVKIPNDAPPGIYSGQVRFNADGVVATDIPLTVEVLPFALESLKDFTPSVFYSPPDWLYPIDMTSFWQRVDEDMIDIREHGFSVSPAPLRSQMLMQVAPYDTDHITVMFSNMRIFMDKFVAHGLQGPVTFYDLWQNAAYHLSKYETMNPKAEWFSDRFNMLFDQIVQQCRAEWALHPEWPELIAEVWDEPSNHDKIDHFVGSDTEEARLLLQRVRAQNLTGITHLADNENSLSLLPDLDIGFVNSRSIVGGLVDAIRQDPSTRLWTYNIAKHYVARTFDGSFERGALGLHSWIIPNVEATVEFMYNSVRGNATMPVTDVWLRETPELMYATFSLPTADNGRRSQIEWEWMREGIDDRRYLAALEAMIESAAAQGITVDSAEAVLQTVRESVPPTNWVDIYRPEPSGGLEAMQEAFGDLEYYQETRRMVANAIVQLQQDIVTGIEDTPTTLPERPELHANYPNPFNPATTVRVSLPRQSQLRLHVYNLLGQRIRTLYDGTREAGVHTFSWNGRSKNGLPAASGVYIVRMTAGNDFVQAMKILLLR
jgi:hypothetical protein